MQRYRYPTILLEELAQCFETNFEVLAAKEFLHPTPAGSKQTFSFCTLKKNNWRRLMKELSFSNNQELLSGLPNASMTYIPNFWSLQEADQIFLVLQEETPWQHDPITVFGKTYMQPV